MKTPQLLTVMAALCLCPTLLWAGDKKAGKLQGYDALTKPKKAVKVKAKLERVIRGLNVLGINPDVEGETLTFFLLEQPVTDPRYCVELKEPKYVGKAKTNSSGLAEIDFTPPRTGVFKLEARVRQGSDYMALPAPLVVASCKAKDKIVVCDIDLTISDTSSLKVAVKDNANIKTADKAVEMLHKIWHDEKRPVIYISAQDSTFLNKTKTWLSDNKLPPGPIFFWDFWSKAWSEETFKTNLLKSLKEGFPGMSTGIGDTTADAKAFLANDMTPHIIQETAPEDLPLFAVHSKNWKKLFRNIKKQDKAEALLKTFSNGDLADQMDSWNQMSRFDKELYGFIGRFRNSTSLETASAAALIVGRMKAREAFVKTLDLSKDGKALNALVAAWRQGDIWIISRLYRKPEVAIGDCDPPVFPISSVSVVKRDEPAEDKVVYKLRVKPADKNKRPVDVTVKMVQTKSGEWRIDTPDF